ncbi:copper resistance CopC family protein [Dyella sp. S184]|uniref:copper resistance CopC family protein n=1 Tax=Dyella sp. S184 TaxID=1641862 RepID=UPI00131E633A|nr:copper resistance CopC family protein [Dyella sp. S184]
MTFNAYNELTVCIATLSSHASAENSLMFIRHRFGILLFIAACAFTSMSVSAHAILVDSTPKPNGTLPAGHVALTFKYNSKIDQSRSRLTLIRPDHSETVLPIASDSRLNELDSGAELAPGAYVIRWQALALDGHITRGDVPFTVIAKP